MKKSDPYELMKKSNPYEMMKKSKFNKADSLSLLEKLVSVFIGWKDLFVPFEIGVDSSKIFHLKIF